MPSRLSPEDYTVIILNVAFFCDIRTLLRLRLSNRATKNLLDSYEKSLCATALKALEVNPLLLCRNTEAFQPTTLKGAAKCWHRTQVINKITRLLLGLNLWNPPAGGWLSAMTYDDPGCAPFRRRVEDGWCLLYHLSDLAAEAETLTDESGRSSTWVPGLWTKHLEVLAAKERERRILAARSNFFMTLSEYDATTFALLWWLIKMFGTWNGPHWYRDARNALNLTNGGAQWLDWYVLRHGPECFSKLWEETDGPLYGPVMWRKPYSCKISEKEVHHIQSEYDALSRRIRAVEIQSSRAFFDSTSLCLRSRKVHNEIRQYERHWEDYHRRRLNISD